jgi:hypothetical protein
MSLTHILVIGPRCWGKGESLKQAIMRARVNYFGGPMPYVAYSVPADAWVDGDGAICWADGSIEIRKIRRASLKDGKIKVEVIDEPA